MRRDTSRILLGICILGIFAAGTSAATPEEVDKAIDKAIKYIYSKQSPAGDWEVVKQRQFDPAKPHENQQMITHWQWGGMTSVATCALMYAREGTQEPRVKKAVEWMIKNETYGIYAQGFRCQVWYMVHQGSPSFPGLRDAARKDMQYLLIAIHKPDQWKDKPWRAGMFPYFYFEKQPQDWYDHSVSQYGVLAAWALAQMNMEVPDAFWKLVDAAWREQQMKTGGWSYRMENKGEKEGGGPPDTTMPMTAAGLATLYITQDMLAGNEFANCPGNKPDANVEAAIKWISQNFDRYKQQHPFYSAYGVERIGVASGRKYLGTRDWYKEIAEFLVRQQKPDGSWGDENGTHNAKKIPDTCFALMALVRGRAPVTMNKLEYVTDARGDKPKPPTWNERPREVANITRWMSKQIEKDLNWQIVNLDHSVNDLHDAPILWISGKEALSFTPDQEAKLKQFVEQGGMIVGHADCASKPFAESYKKLGTRLFGNEFRELPEAHVIYTGQPFKRALWKGNLSLLGLTNGTRELMLLYATTDPGKLWQVQSFAGANQPGAELMANIFLYAVDKKNLRNKGETYLVERKGDVKIERSVKLARIEYAGNWDPEPASWRRMKNVVANNHKIDLIVEPLKLGNGKLGAYQIAHLTGTTGFRLSEAEQAELKKFVEGGGTLLIDAAGGATDFANKADELLAAMFGGSRANVLKPDHALYAGKKIAEFEYRNFAVKVIGNIKSPRIRGIDVGGKTRVLVSAEDLSVGMVGMPIDGIYGYDPKTATAIVENVILYAAKK